MAIFNPLLLELFCDLPSKRVFHFWNCGQKWVKTRYDKVR